jgi:hypothetical protein
MHDAPQSNRPSRPTPVKAPIIGRAGSGKVQWEPAPRSNWRRRSATTSRLRQVACRITLAVPNKLRDPNPSGAKMLARVLVVIGVSRLG